ncbi:hypothetical protein LTR78_009711 [Recurvomyces mirabilis]|uniref:Uncharacterized protein n=1 Tax=Recurvomyces mirabilis TaxID=574656 RepID=A0AAE0TMU4_9PEZI|nr:hypothetical protein LTR78_009711 [Recurvomyces mirabilis]KAK5150247.1 hypothetical protein LTS14_010223 [Recurvomyces mirabilis]
MSTQLWTKRVCATQTVDAKKEAVFETIQGPIDDTIDPAEGARSIASNYETYVKHEMQQASDYYKLGSLWCNICEATRHFGSSKAGALADLLIALYSLPPVLDDSGQPLKNVDGQAYWTGLPESGVTFGEYGIDIDHVEDYNDEEEAEDWLKQAPSFHNATAFAATISTRSTPDFGMVFHAYEAFDLALGDAVKPQKTERTAMYLPAAAMWTRTGGVKLYRFCAGRSGVESAAADVLAQGGHGLSLGRWSHWRERFEALALAEIGEIYQEIAASAASRMKETEIDDPA